LGSSVIGPAGAPGVDAAKVNALFGSACAVYGANSREFGLQFAPSVPSATATVAAMDIRFARRSRAADA
jgi:hypothetical protein